jgi:hypothetical protein
MAAVTRCVETSVKEMVQQWAALLQIHWIKEKPVGTSYCDE